MFGSSKRAPAFSEQVETIIGQATQVKGTVSAGGTIRVDGQVEGEIAAKGDIIIGETGTIRAQMKGRSATIAGTVHGNVDVLDKLELTPSGKLYGDIKTGVLIIGEGAIFKGSCEMRQGNDKPGELVNQSREVKVSPAKS
ncbi:MAG TPA: polymer-forming cytoskeletal protein [Negativicutes bacterium]|nr:polymer-forming cytoskeletal protein [Negativicutes bacterium]